MARSAARPEVAEQTLVRVPFEYKRPVPPGATVTLHYSLDEGKSWQDSALTPSADGFTGGVEMEDGTKYQFLFKIQVPGQPEDWFPRGGVGVKLEGIAKAGDVESPSPTHAYAAVRSALKARVSNILEAAKTRDTAQNIEALFDDFRSEVDGMGITDDIRPMILQVAVEVIHEMQGLPKSITQLFPEKQNLVKDFNDLEDRLKRGSQAYRRKVFEQLRNDPVARRHFGLEKRRATYNPVDPLGNTSLNRLFDRLCSSKDLGHLTTDIGLALSHMSPVPARSPAVQTRLGALATRVGARLTPEKRALLTRVPPGFFGKTLDTAVQLGLVGVVGGGIGFGAYAGKAVLETVAGAGLKDVLAALKKDPHGRRNFKMLWEMVKNNFIGTRLWRAKEGHRKEVLLSALKQTAIRMIPTSPVWYKPGADEVEPDGAEVESTKDVAAEASKEAMTASPEKLITDATEKALTQ